MNKATIVTTWTNTQTNEKKIARWRVHLDDWGEELDHAARYFGNGFEDPRHSLGGELIFLNPTNTQAPHYPGIVAFFRDSYWVVEVVAEAPALQGTGFYPGG